MIRIDVKGQKLSACKCETLVSDSLNIIDIKFAFSEEWGGLTKTVQFHQIDEETKKLKTYNVLLDESDEAMLPNEIKAGVVLISVFGVSGNVRLTTAALALPVEKSGFVGDGETPIPPTPDLYQQIIARFEEATQGESAFDEVVTALGYRPLSDDSVSFSQSDVQGGYEREYTIKVGNKKMAIITQRSGTLAPAIEVTAAGDTIADAAGGMAKSVVVELNPITENGAIAPAEDGGAFAPHMTCGLNVNGIEHNALLDGEAYAGTYDFVSGRIVSTAHKVSAKDFISIVEKGTNSAGVKYIRIDATEYGFYSMIACNRYTRKDDAPYVDKSIRVRYDTAAYVYDNDIDLDNPENILDGLEFLFPLETPVTYESQGQAITLDKGTNNIMSGTGAVAVTYGVDTKTYIDNKFAALSAAMLGG